ncbi:protein NEOXANTHIN-DEFICIENT 1 [Tasmannia lanceolata]|uniref:protein NEOXANTHIN-DEFICIENT 1 n=1 Tax=Tasmannia lanceolata TaxID=3420 RepID=UPI004063D86A
MEVVETKPSSGYANGPPWLFKGSALYQLHLVKADIARAFIPKHFRLVEAFGYTLGGFFLAHYDDSPAGNFDELVVIAGIVWNPPTSCAWAARVLVNSNEACRHGRKDVGLPSHVARFSKRVVATTNRPGSRSNGFLNVMGMGPTFCNPKEHTEIQVNEFEGSASTSLCNINLPAAELKLKSNEKWLGPPIKMSLPSFSGLTEHNPHLLKYSCQIECRVRPVEPAKISGPNTTPRNDQDISPINPDFYSSDLTNGASPENNVLKRTISVLLSKPILALEFNSLKMQVEAPSVVTLTSKKAVGDT